MFVSEFNLTFYYSTRPRKHRQRRGRFWHSYFNSRGRHALATHTRVGSQNRRARSYLAGRYAVSGETAALFHPAGISGVGGCRVSRPMCLVPTTVRNGVYYVCTCVYACLLDRENRILFTCTIANPRSYDRPDFS